MAFGRKQDEIDALANANEILQARVAEQDRIIESVDEIGRIATKELRELADTGVLETEARAIASVAVIARERDRLTKELAEKLKAEEYDEHAAKVRIEEGSKIRQQLHELFESDGTYEELKRRAEHDVRVSLQQEVLEAYRATLLVDLSDEETRRKYKIQIWDEVKDSEDVSDYRQQARNELEAVWSEEVIAEVKEEVRTEELSREDEFKRSYGVEWSQSNKGQRFRQDVRSELEEAWRQKGVDEIAQAIKDEELQNLLEQKAEQERLALENSVRSSELVKQFEGLGIDTTKLVGGDELIIYLGKTKVETFEETRPRKGGYGGNETVKVDKTVLECKRKIILTSQGEGKFIVDGDSLLESGSAYEREFALHRGTIIVVGRKVRENGDARLDQKIAADVPFYYDDDTTNVNIVDALEPVASAKVNGVVARTWDVYRRV